MFVMVVTVYNLLLISILMLLFLTGTAMAAPGDMPGQDEGFAEIDTQEDEAMEVANSAWEQEGKLV